MTTITALSVRDVLLAVALADDPEAPELTGDWLDDLGCFMQDAIWPGWRPDALGRTWAEYVRWAHAAHDLAERSVEPSLVFDRDAYCDVEHATELAYGEATAALDELLNGPAWMRGAA